MLSVRVRRHLMILSCLFFGHLSPALSQPDLVTENVNSTTKPSQIAASNGFKYLMRSIPSKYLVSTIRSGNLDVFGQASEIENMNIDVMEMDSDQAQTGRIYFELVAQHQLSSKILQAGNGVVLVLDLETLDRSDYHISTGWPFGYYISQFGTPEDSTKPRIFSSAEPVFLNPKLLPENNELVSHYIEMLKVIADHEFKSLGGTHFADIAKDFMARLNKYGKSNIVISETFRQLAGEAPAQDWSKLIADAFDSKNFEIEQAKFSQLLKNISLKSKSNKQGVGQQNEVVVRDTVSLQHLKYIIVPSEQRESLLKTLEKLGKPANFGLRIKNWPDLFVIADTYSELPSSGAKSCRSIF